MSNSSQLPLELHFADVAAKRQAEFPDSNNYWDRYWSMLTVLREQFYKHVNVGLAVHSGSIAGVYTDHSGDHFDEVVKYAGMLAGIDGSEANDLLKPFEIYLLLMGIRLHDAGNLLGRDGHEKKALEIYKLATPPASRDRFETQVITKIAQYHGGKTSTGSKDTISQLKEVDHLGSSTPFRPRMVAALVRLADEICEHRGRVSPHLIDLGGVPPQNMLYHLYAAAIKSSVVNRREKSVSLQYVLHKRHLLTPYEDATRPGERKYLLDETFDRLGKLNLERIYCNQFLDPPLQISRVIATVAIVDGPDDEETLKECLVEIKPEGYPNDDQKWRAQTDGFTGEKMSQSLSGSGG